MVRRRKLARQRRQKDVEGYRADERERQSRSRRGLAQTSFEPCDPKCHVPASTLKCLELWEELHRIPDGPFRVSRAGFGQELRRIERKIGSMVGKALAQYGPYWTVSRAGFGL